MGMESTGFDYGGGLLKCLTKSLSIASIVLLTSMINAQETFAYVN